MPGPESVPGILALGLLVGLRHAFEADHVMAVATLASDQRPGGALRQGLVWGLGHTLTLLLVGGAVIWADSLIPARVANALEAAVGVMLLVLGGDLIRRVVVGRWHVHAHRHADGRRHVHLHCHADSERHDPALHEHPHPPKLPLRALLVGMMHGLAGTAALLVLTLQTVPSLSVGIAYIAVFGVGSIAGMGLTSICIAVPLNTPAFGRVGLRSALSVAVGVLTLGLGLVTLVEAGLGGLPFG